MTLYLPVVGTRPFWGEWVRRMSYEHSNVQGIGSALSSQAVRFSELIAKINDPLVPVPRLDWNVLQLSIHVATLLESFAFSLGGGALVDRFPSLEGMPIGQYLATVNESLIVGSGITTLGQAAQQVRSGADRLAALLETVDLESPQKTPWYGSNETRSAGSLARTALFELLVHGWDLSSAIGVHPELPGESARIAAGMMNEMLPMMVNPETTKGVHETYRLDIRRSITLTVRIDDGEIRIIDNSEPAACHLSVKASTALLLAAQRIPLWRAIATGGIMSGGRKPWLGSRFTDYVVAP